MTHFVVESVNSPEVCPTNAESLAIHIYTKPNFSVNHGCVLGKFLDMQECVGGGGGGTEYIGNRK